MIEGAFPSAALGLGREGGQGEGGERPGRVPPSSRPRTARPPILPGARLRDGVRGRGHRGDAPLPRRCIHTPNPERAPGSCSRQASGRKHPRPHGLEDHQKVLHLFLVGRVHPNGGGDLTVTRTPALGHGHLGCRPSRGACVEDSAAAFEFPPREGGGSRPPALTLLQGPVALPRRGPPGAITGLAAPEESIRRPRALTVRWP